MNRGILREYDIRGIAERDLTDEIAYGIGRAVASRLKREGARALCLGRDVRASSPRLQAAAARGVIESGVDVIDNGIVTTPLLYYSIVDRQAGGGIMVTGSHNPIEYNGVKVTRGTSPIWGDEIRALGDQIEQADYESGRGSRSELEIFPAYRQMVAERLARGRSLKIVVDAGNGTGGLIGPDVLRDAGHEVVCLYCEPDGSFPNHLPDPTVAAYVEDLQARVLAEGADLGIGFDGDADRIGLVDERGRMIYGDQLLALYARELLERLPGSRILFDVKCSQGLEEDIRAHGGEPVMWKTGHSLLKAKMKEEQIPLAGEMSGHMFFSEGYFGFDDAVYGAARIAAYLGRCQEPLGTLIDSLPQYVNSPEIRVPCPDERKFEVVAAVARDFAGEHEVVTIDGARVVFAHGWGLLRASNTQPVLVLRFESQSTAGLAEIEEAFRASLRRFPEVEWQA